MGPHSDVDVLVVKRGDYNLSQVVGDIYMGLYGARQAVDVLMVTPEQLEQYHDRHCLVIAPALRGASDRYGDRGTQTSTALESNRSLAKNCRGWRDDLAPAKQAEIRGHPHCFSSTAVSGIGRISGMFHYPVLGLHCPTTGFLIV